MNINLSQLIKLKACSEGLIAFENKYGMEDVDVKDVYVKCSNTTWKKWLIEKFGNEIITKKTIRIKKPQQYDTIAFLGIDIDEIKNIIFSYPSYVDKEPYFNITSYNGLPAIVYTYPHNQYYEYIDIKVPNNVSILGMTELK